MPQSTALPKYVQIAEMMIREIASGRIADGARLPPERSMAAELGIAVGTLRKALADLADKGLLDRVQGSGNYVRHRAESAGIYAFFRLELAEGGGLPTAEVLDVRCMPKPADLPEFGRSELGHRIRRLRRLSGRPAAMEEIWLDGHWSPEIARDELLESLYLFYRTRLGLSITHAEDRIGVGSVPDWAVPEFGKRPGATCGFVERWSRSDTGENVEYSRTWFDQDMARYVARMR